MPLQDDTETTRSTLGRLRLQEMAAGPVLDQILALRAIVWSGRISLAPDLLRWGDAVDTRASHWCIFKDAELIAAGRMSVHSAFEDIADHQLFEPLRSSMRYPVALMSRSVVHPRFRNLHLVKALDAARIERAHQLRCPLLLATTEDERRARTLQQAGFSLLDVPFAHAEAGSRATRGCALVIDLSHGHERLGAKGPRLE